MESIDTRLQEAWDKILMLDSKAQGWENKYKKLQLDHHEFKLQLNHQLQVLVRLVNG